MDTFICRAACITFLALTGLTSPAADSPPQMGGLSGPAPQPAPSRGLVNDWLLDQSPAFAPWNIGGQVRGRYELFDDGSLAFPNRDFQRLGVDADNSYLWTRERLHVGYNSSWFRIYGEGQNANSTGDNDPRNPGQDPFDLFQAYVSLGDPQVFPVTATIGRQELSYGDERLIGASDWSNTGRAFDAAKLRYAHESFWVDAFAGRVVLTDDDRFNEPDYDDWFFGLYASSDKLVPMQESQLYLLSRNSGAGAAVSPRDIYSIGARVKSLPGKLHGWDYFTEVVGQFGGVNQGGQRLEQRALASAVGGGYTWQEVWASPRLGLEYDYATGDHNPNDDTSETLDNLFPTNHKHYGLMDFLSWRNMQDLRFALGLKPMKKLTVSVDYFLFWLADTHDFFYPQGGAGRSGLGYGRNPGFDSFLGSELDVELNYAVTSWAGLRAGYGHFFTGSYIDSSKQSVGGATDADWFYVQATLLF